MSAGSASVEPALFGRPRHGECTQVNMRHKLREEHSEEQSKTRDSLEQGSGPDSLIGVTEGGRTVFWFVLVMIIAAVLIAGFFGTVNG